MNNHFCDECGVAILLMDPRSVSAIHLESCSLHPKNVAPVKATSLEISQPEVIERLARALIEEIDKAGPKDLQHAKMLLEVHAEDYSVRASRRRLYRALAEILDEEAQS